MTRVILINVMESGQTPEHLGLAYIAAFLRTNGFDVSLEYIELDQHTRPEQAFLNMRTDAKFFGFSLFSETVTTVFSLARLLKARDPECKVFTGGYLATVAPEVILKDCEAIDFVVLGEGEIPLLRALNEIEAGGELGKLESIVTREISKDKLPYLLDQCALTQPARDFLPLSKKLGHLHAWVLTSRGCEANCGFCAQSYFRRVLGKKAIPRRDIQDVFEEIIHLHQDYGIQSFSFADGSFEDPGKTGKARIKQLCQLLQSYPSRLHFSCFIRAESFDYSDQPLLDLMRSVGFTRVFIGAESGSPADLKLYRKRASVADNQRAVTLFRKSNIHIELGVIMFNPTSTVQSLQETCDFLLRNSVGWIEYYISHLKLYYGTALHDEFRLRGYLKPDFSYLNPTGYYFQDSTVSKISAFVNSTIRQSPTFVRDASLYSEYYLSSLEAIYPNEYQPYAEEISSLRKSYAIEVGKYFDYLFHRLDLSAAKYDSLCERLNRILDSYDSLKMKIIMTEPFKSYFIRPVPSISGLHSTKPAGQQR